MKKIVMLGLVLVLVLTLTGCQSEEKDTENEAVSQVDTGEGEQQTADGLKIEDDTEEIFSLYTDDKSASIQVKMPKGYGESDYSAETALAFQCPEDGGENITQFNLRLVTDSEDTVMATAKQEVQYLLSANSDGDGVTDEVQSITEGEKRWSYFSYSMEGLEGYRVWTSLENGCVLVCTVENLGSGLEPLNAESIIQELNEAIL